MCIKVPFIFSYIFTRLTSQLKEDSDFLRQTPTIALQSYQKELKAPMLYMQNCQNNLEFVNIIPGDIFLIKTSCEGSLKLTSYRKSEHLYNNREEPKHMLERELFCIQFEHPMQQAGETPYKIQSMETRRNISYPGMNT